MRAPQKLTARSLTGVKGDLDMNGHYLPKSYYSISTILIEYQLHVLRRASTRTTQTLVTGYSSVDEASFYQDLTDTDIPEADLAAHQAFTKAMAKGRLLVRQ